MDFKCRVCLLKVDDPSYSLFSENENVRDCLTNADLIMACSSVQIAENDGLPQTLCSNCYDKLAQLYEFKRQCEDSDKLLHDTISIKIENWEIPKYEDDSMHPVETDTESNVSNLETTYNCACCQQIFNPKEYLSHIQTQYLTKLKKHIFKKITTKKKFIEHAEIKLEKHGGSHKATDIRVEFACEFCKRKRTFPSAEMLRIHSRESHLCKYCGGTFEKKIILEQHLKEKHNKGLVNKSQNAKCPMCGEHFDNLEDHHKNVHKTNTCPSCSKVFIKYNYFKRHLMNSNCQQQARHLCPYCGRSFKEQGNLTAHIRIHTGERPYACDFCDKTFAQWSSLRSHRVTHTGEKNYACEVCGKAFSRLLTLKKHLISHSDVMNYSCEICEKKFKHSRSVKEHMVIHTGVKRFKCEFCDKAFGFKKNLVVHRRTHTGDKPYGCEVCSQAFTQRHCLRAHMNSHHKSLSITPAIKVFS